ncbi:hypothetical protein B0H66DRAFT_565104 [Apodospora peruviana]|uniref:Uncharacterized protein n=1 Tax=Apodospora peruviana TaxID=516989 RepID=A0AAE0M1G4_9PEZI|nr:hypothetical protein B0H66DRAFT_565104 [Apodospora peruviana]
MPRAALPPEAEAKLREYPFTRLQTQDSPPRDDATRCQSIRSKLRSDMAPSDSDFEFLKEHPEQAIWFREHIESRFRLKLEHLARLRGDQGAVCPDV